MDVQPLMDIVCAQIASMVKDRDVEEIKKTFGIASDFTDEIEAEILEKNPWLKEVWCN